MSAPPANTPKAVIVGGTKVALGANNYLASGGEAAIYTHGSKALRVYHDRSKMVEPGRLKELTIIQTPHVVKPIDIITDAMGGDVVGFSMALVQDVEPLVRFFSRQWLKTKGVGVNDITGLVKAIQADVHSLISGDKVLPVDLNEMNILANPIARVPWWIDIASWATPSFPATAIMESIRDPAVVNNKFDANSTWYSFAVIAVQLYLGLHPFHGMHPKYKVNQWKTRMSDGASVFDTGAKGPPSTPPLSVIPPRHLDWFKSIFVPGHYRCPAPDIDATPPAPQQPQPVTPKAAMVVRGSANFSVERLYALPEDIISITSIPPYVFAVTSTAIHKFVGETGVKMVGKAAVDQMQLCPIDHNNTVIIRSNKATAQFYRYCHNNAPDTGLIDQIPLQEPGFVRHDRFYSVRQGKLVQHEFRFLGGKVIRDESETDNVSQLTTKTYDGILFQDLLGKVWATYPVAASRSFSQAIPALDGHRIVEAKAMARTAVVSVERAGGYKLVVLQFSEDGRSHTSREIPDVRDVNFVALPNGLNVLCVNDAVQVFYDDKKVRVVDNPPFDTAMPLFVHTGGVGFIDGNEAYKLALK